MPAGTFAVAVFHAQRNGAQMESGLFGKLERRHGAFRTTFSVAACVTLLKHLEKLRAPAIASEPRLNAKFPSVRQGLGAWSRAYAPSRRLWRWSAFHSPPSHRSFHPVRRSSRPATSLAGSASDSSGPRCRWRSRAVLRSRCPASKPRRGPPRPSSSSAKFASSAPPSTPPPNWPNSMPISSAKRSR